MDRPRKHPWQFAHRVLPETFHREPAETIRALSMAGGNTWLASAWSEAGRLLAPSDRLDAAIGYTFEPLDPAWKVVVVRLPPPTRPGEGWFAAICFKPARATMLVFATPSESHYLVLERTGDGAQVREWHADGHYTIAGTIEPTRAAFVDHLKMTLQPA